MKKSDFITLVIGVVGVLLFGVGMCMCLLPECNAFDQGLVVAAIGAVILLVLAIVSYVRSGKKSRLTGASPARSCLVLLAHWCWGWVCA